VDGQADLARLARTSRIWFSPSIARLWYSSINFRHILALIPRTTSDQNGSLINVRAVFNLSATVFHAHCEGNLSRRVYTTDV
ncbi:hypothetical protein FRC08_014009, partial [Ceratobasidium sp. 394]